MGAKLKFTDVVNNELDASKLNYTGVSNAMSTGTGAPSADASVGSVYKDTSSGALYIKRVVGAGASNWEILSTSGSTTSLPNNIFRNITINGAITGTGLLAPVLGDLVGLFGVGAWSNSNNITHRRGGNITTGNVHGSLVAAGSTGAASVVGITSTEVSNGSSWQFAPGASSNIQARVSPAGGGSQNAAWMATGTGAISTSEIFNGAVWIVATATVLEGRSTADGYGSSSAGTIVGGAGSGRLRSTELFNGSSWAAAAAMNVSRIQLGACGTQSSSLVVGGYTGALTNTVSNNSEINNGSSWSLVGTSVSPRWGIMTSGSPGSALAAGGVTAGDATGFGVNTCEIFNGSIWFATGNINTARLSGHGAGSTSFGLIAGGNTSNVAGAVISTEIHSQTIYRKVSPRYLASTKNIGIIISASDVLITGSNSSVSTIYYPANKCLVVNDKLLSISSSAADFSAGIALASVQSVTTNVFAYNFVSSITTSQLMPGMTVRVVAGGATPVTTNNTGILVISRVASNSSVEVLNTLGTVNNPGTGTLFFNSTMLAVDSPSTGDIVIGKTDANGILTISRPLTTSSFAKRNK